MEFPFSIAHSPRFAGLSGARFIFIVIWLKVLRAHNVKMHVISLRENSIFLQYAGRVVCIQRIEINCHRNKSLRIHTILPPLASVWFSVTGWVESFKARRQTENLGWQPERFELSGSKFKLKKFTMLPELFSTRLDGARLSFWALFFICWQHGNFHFGLHRPILVIIEDENQVEIHLKLSRIPYTCEVRSALHWSTSTRQISLLWKFNHFRPSKLHLPSLGQHFTTFF